jgi:hypothetical protein
MHFRVQETITSMAMQMAIPTTKSMAMQAPMEVPMEVPIITSMAMPMLSMN